jgi:hypothetical protein
MTAIDRRELIESLARRSKVVHQSGGHHATGTPAAERLFPAHRKARRQRVPPTPAPASARASRA